MRQFGLSTCQYDLWKWQTFPTTASINKEQQRLASDSMSCSRALGVLRVVGGPSLHRPRAASLGIQGGLGWRATLREGQTDSSWIWDRSLGLPGKDRGWKNMDRDVRVQTTAHLGSFHMLARSRSKSFKIGFNSTWTKNLQMDKLNLEKAEELEIKLSTSGGPP